MDDVPAWVRWMVYQIGGFFFITSCKPTWNISINSAGNFLQFKVKELTRCFMPNLRMSGENCSIFNCYFSRAHPAISFLRIPTKNDDKIKLEEQHCFSIWLWLDSIMSGALFIKLFPKTRRKWILFKSWKWIKVSGHIHFEHILFFRIWIFGYLNLKLF